MYNEDKEVTELLENQADIALDAIDALPKKMIALADAVTRLPGLEMIPFSDWNDFIGTIEIAWDDLFEKERIRLMKIAGYRDEPKSMYQRPARLTVEAMHALLNSANSIGNKEAV